MNKVRIWDLPVRLLHWALAIGFLLAIGIAVVAGEHSPQFSLHKVIGVSLLGVIFLRVAWGIMGPKHVRLTGFFHSPTALVAYVKGLLGGTPQLHAGHNPLAGLVMFAILVLVPVTVVSGIQMSNGMHWLEEVHAVLAWSVVALVGLHLIGLVLHTVKFKENIAMSMVTGRKLAERERDHKAYALTAILMLGVLALWGVMVWGGYAPAKNQLTIPVVNKTISLGENEGGKLGGSSEGQERHKDDDD